jgi:hypothetical protein
MMDAFTIIGKPVSGESHPRSSKDLYLIRRVLALRIRRSYLLTSMV